MTTEAESAVIEENEVRECQQPPSEAGRARNRFSPRTFRGKEVCSHLDFGSVKLISGFPPLERISFCSFKPPNSQ